MQYFDVLLKHQIFVFILGTFLFYALFALDLIEFDEFVLISLRYTYKEQKQ